MLRLLGILTLGGLIFGGRRRRRALRRGLFLGALLGYFASRHENTARVREEVRHAAGEAKRAARDAAETVRREIREVRRAARDERVEEHLREVHARTEERVREAHERTEERLREIHERAEARRAERQAAQQAAQQAPAAQTVQPVQAVQEDETIHTAPILETNEELVADLERDARTAAMAADVPTIDFPEEDEKYHASRRYGYV